jgi:hypothetical protein
MVLVEFQAEADPEMFGRAMEYLGGAWRREKPTGHAGDRFELGLVVVNLTGRGSSFRRMSWPEAGLETVVAGREWNLAELDAAEVLDQAVAGRAPAIVLTWIPLMKRGDEAGIIQRWLEVAGQVADLRVRRDLRLAAGFAEAAKRGPVWQEALKGWDVEEPIFVKELEARAMLKQQIDSLLRVLRARFNSVPEDLVSAIRETTELHVLDGWLITAATSVSLDAFRQAIGK